MAITHPASPTFQTTGEEKVFVFLKQSLPDSWLLFYEPRIVDATPDIVLFSPYLGAMVIEVKDYTSHTIKKLTLNYWELTLEGQTKSVLSPYEQVRRYKHKLTKLLESHNEFCVKDGIFQGKVIFPIMCVCWMVNISEHDSEVMGISKVVPKEHLLTKNHFEKPSALEGVLSSILTTKFKINEEVPQVLTNTFVKILYPTLIVREYEALRNAWFQTFKPNILSFASVVDEVLYIATEIRHLRTKGVPLNSIFLYVQDNRHLRRNRILVEVEHILSDMGVIGIQLGVLDNCHVPNNQSYTFIMDLKSAGMDEKKEAALNNLLREASGRVWFTTSYSE